jgi:hypothetical protein
VGLVDLASCYNNRHSVAHVAYSRTRVTIYVNERTDLNTSVYDTCVHIAAICNYYGSNNVVMADVGDDMALCSACMAAAVSVLDSSDTKNLAKMKERKGELHAWLSSLGPCAYIYLFALFSYRSLPLTASISISVSILS